MTIFSIHCPTCGNVQYGDETTPSRVVCLNCGQGLTIEEPKEAENAE